MGSYFRGGSPSNYTIGGVRFWFNRLADGSTTPKRYEGYRDLGNIVEPSVEVEKDELEHFSARSGTRTRDRSLLRSITEDIVLTVDELSLPNLRDYFNGGAVSRVAAAVGGGSVNDEIAYAFPDEEDPTVLGKGYNASSIVIKDITDMTTYVENTDYEIIDWIGGYKAILWLSGGSLNAAGEYVRIDYTYDIRAHRTFNPLTENAIEGKAVFFGVSDTGNEFIREFEQCSLEREGTFSLNPEDWSNFQFRVKILDDSEVNPTMPAGIFRHYGVGTNL